MQLTSPKYSQYSLLLSTTLSLPYLLFTLDFLTFDYSTPTKKSRTSENPPSFFLFLLPQAIPKKKVNCFFLFPANFLSLYLLRTFQTPSPPPPCLKQFFSSRQTALAYRFASSSQGLCLKQLPQLKTTAKIALDNSHCTPLKQLWFCPKSKNIIASKMLACS